MKPAGTINAHPNPIEVVDRYGVGVTTLEWRAEGVEAVEVRVDAPDGPLFSQTDSAGSAMTGAWVRDGMTFYLQDASQGSPLTAAHTLATVAMRVKVADALPALILMYHRVDEVGADPWSLAVTPQHFSEQLAVLRAHSQPWPLQQLARALEEGTNVDRAVVVTFDDGYADNLHQAKPLLESYDIPATVFVTAGYVGAERGFWWDTLGWLLLRPGRLPELLRLTIGGATHQWQLGAAADYTEDAGRQHRHWRAARQHDPSPRHTLYRALHQLLKPLSESARLAVLDELLAWAGAPAASGAAGRILSAGEVRDLARGGLIEIGSHALTHSDLGALAPESQREEVAHSKVQLEALTGSPVLSLAYPYGAYTAEVVSFVREAGYNCACSVSTQPIKPQTDCYQLPRMMVEDWDGEEFARRLSGWFER